jgi:FkbH-like protein
MNLFDVGHATAEATRRRERYRAEEQRTEALQCWSGRRSDFLASCEMVARIGPATPDDVNRVFELIERTNRFNSSAEAYDRAEVARCVAAEDNDVIVARLVDRFGDHGLVGAMIVRRSDARSSIRVLLVSCRVLGRGVGEALLCAALRQAADRGERALDVWFRRTEHNRMMSVLFASHAFHGVTPDGPGERQGEVMRFTHDLQDLPDVPTWLTVLT